MNGDADSGQLLSSSNRMKRHDVGGADPATTTTDGCTCRTQCEATMDFGLAKNDWCKTGNETNIRWNNSASMSKFSHNISCI